MAKIGTNASCITCWPNLEPILVASPGGQILNWRDNSSYRLYTLGPLCLWALGPVFVPKDLVAKGCFSLGKRRPYCFEFLRESRDKHLYQCASNTCQGLTDTLLLLINKYWKYQISIITQISQIHLELASWLGNRFRVGPNPGGPSVSVGSIITDHQGRGPALRSYRASFIINWGPYNMRDFWF